MFKEWMSLRESAGDYVINCNWVEKYGEYKSKLSIQDVNAIATGMNTTVDVLKRRQASNVPEQWTNNVPMWLSFVYGDKFELATYNGKDVKQITIPGAGSVQSQPTTQNNPNQPKDNFDILNFIDVANKMSNDAFINTLYALMQKHRNNEKMNYQELQALKLLKNALTRMEISPQDLPEWRKYENI